MRNILLYLTLVAVSVSPTNAQTVIKVYKQTSFTPGPADSVSAYGFKTYNCGSSSLFKNAENEPPGVVDELCTASWTYSAKGCSTGAVRAYQKFPGLSTLPTNITIDSAKLVLKGKTGTFYTIQPGNSYYPGSPYNSYGTNEVELMRVTQNWSFSKLTWNNSPNTSTRNIIVIPPSTKKAGYDVTLDVSSLVQDMVDSSTPYGFSLKQRTEVYYRSMIFFSSFAKQAEDRPELRVYYHYDSTIQKDDSTYDDRDTTTIWTGRATTGISTMSEVEQSINLYPNPVESYLNLEFSISSGVILDYEVRSISGQLMMHEQKLLSAGHNRLSVNVTTLPKGMYIISLHDGEKAIYKRFAKL